MMFILLITSCDSKVKEYYENGNLRKVYTKKNNQLQGDYLVYFDDGITLKESHIYIDGVKKDTSFYYDPNRQLTELNIWNDSLPQFKVVIKNQKGEILEEGVRISDKDSAGVKRFGIWKFYVSNNFYKDSLVEYINFRDKTYVNQIWLVNKQGDTLQDRGNYFESAIYDKETQNDTTTLGNITRLKFLLTKPMYGLDSDMFVVLPFDDDDLRDDFSNLQEIKRDTFPSLMNDGISRSNIPDYVKANLFTEFGLEYGKSGTKRVRGVVVEVAGKNSEYYGRERRLFFDKTFYVKDTLPQLAPE